MRKSIITGAMVAAIASFAITVIVCINDLDDRTDDLEERADALEGGTLETRVWKLEALAWSAAEGHQEQTERLDAIEAELGIEQSEGPVLDNPKREHTCALCEEGHVHIFASYFEVAPDGARELMMGHCSCGLSADEYDEGLDGDYWDDVPVEHGGRR